MRYLRKLSIIYVINKQKLKNSIIIKSMQYINCYFI